MEEVYKKEILGRCPHYGCGGRIVKEITGGLLTLPQPYCEKCGTLFKFVSRRAQQKRKRSSLKTSSRHKGKQFVL